jgi:selenocysteine lyase/cysteine desulfurase
MLGTRDYSAMLAVPAAIDFWERLGGDRVARRNRALALRAGRMLAAAWGTSLGAPEGCVASTCMVGLPACFGETEDDGIAARERIRAGAACAAPGSAATAYDSVVVQRPVPAAGTGRLWLRISAAVYNCYEEYEALRDVVLGLARRAAVGGEEGREP